jgi:hypothetical protein
MRFKISMISILLVISERVLTIWGVISNSSICVMLGSGIVGALFYFGVKYLVGEEVRK